MTHWLEGIFQFLFKYRPTEFAKGSLAFGVPFSVVILLLAVAAIGIPVILSYAGVRGKSSKRDRWVLGAIRVAALVVLVACLFRPMLLLSAAVPQRNYVGVLIDDSRSMRIADRGAARADWVEHAFGGPDGALLKALKQKFIVRLFRFSSGAQRVDSITDLKFDAAETHLGSAIEQARQELDAVPLSGLVVLSDGADNSRAPIGDELLSLRSKSVPIFTVGLGAEKFDKDIEIRRVEASHSVLKGGALVADLLIRQHGFAGARVPLVVEDAGRIISRDSITLPRDGDVAPVRVTVVAHDAGPRSFTFRIPVQAGEQVEQNNVQQTLVDVRDGREKILYVEGEPRYEMRFIRAAVEADSNIQLVALQRTAENKFLRLNIDGADELSSGFPKTRAELFHYRAIIIGSVEASFFTHDQLAMLAEFVNTRGGGLLMLGGRRSFAEGGYAGTPVADVMPVTVTGNAVADSMTFFADLKVALAPAGMNHAVAQVGPTPAVSVLRWKTLPAVTSVNRIRAVKPGAVTLITGSLVSGGKAGEPGAPLSAYEQPVLVYQRYGRGLSIAMPIQDSWNWQMDPASAEQDQTFERFWRQMLRWLTSDVPNRVVVTLPMDQANPKNPIAIRATVVDSIFVARNDAKVVAHLTSDSGFKRDLPLDWAIDRDGEYRGTFTPDQPGVYSVRVEATFPSGGAAGDTTFVRVADLNTEYFDAEMRAPLLKRIASETGGKFYTPATANTLPEDVALSKHGVTIVNQMDLWDMPAVLLLLVALVSAEWAYPKSAGVGVSGTPRGKREGGSGKRGFRQVLSRAAVCALLAIPVSRVALHAQQTHLIIVAGLGGEKKYIDSFSKASQTLADAAASRFGIPDSEIAWFGEDSVSNKPHYRGQATKVNIERAITQLAGRAGSGDQIIFVLIGHGSGDGPDTKISIPGPDLSARDFAQLLSRFPTQKLAFVNLTSASGDMLPVLAAPNRVIITATKSAFERNESHFAQYFIDALTKDVADTDKDGRVSLLEAFRYATVETRRLYDNDTRLQTEHAQLDDMGAKTGVADPDGRTGQGILARRFFLDGAFATKAGANDPQLATLYKDKFGIEDQIDLLRTKKTSMTAIAYDDALETLLVQLARKAKTIREIEGRKS